MNRVSRENESRFFEQVVLYREEYRKSRSAALNEERERRHADGEVYIAGYWVPRTEAWRVAQGLQRKEFLAFFEILALLILLVVIARGVWWLFAFLLLP